MLTLFQLLTVALSAEPATAAEYISKHRAGLEQVRTLAVDVEVILRPSAGPVVPLCKTRFWRDGRRERHVETYLAVGDAETGVFSPIGGDQGLRHEIGYDEHELRVLDGWDPDHPPPLPLKPGGAHAQDYTATRCSISPHDPSTAYRPISLWLLLVATPTQTLEELVGASTSVAPQLDATGIVSLTVQNEQLGRVVCSLNPDAGYLLSRIEFFAPTDENGAVTSTFEVLEFSEPKPGIFFPMRTRSFAPGRPALEITVNSVKVNEPIADDLVHVEFPAGARVDQPSRGMVHVWGSDGKPQLSFTDHEEFRKWEVKTASRGGDATGNDKTAAIPTPRGNIQKVVLLNLGVLMLIGILVYVRRRLHKSPTN